MLAAAIALLATVPAAGIDAHFAMCGAAKRVTCIVDGDTIWLGGTKIRLADIDTPETVRPACPRERAMGQRATRRMQALLNDGPITLRRDGRDEDRWGRKLRIVERDGSSLGEVLVGEGLARRWGEPRVDWCAIPAPDS